MNELVIVKVGTTTLVDEAGKLDEASFLNIADALKAEKERGSDVMLVTSAAISAGAAELGLSRESYAKDLDSLSALAAAGQVPLMDKWAGYLEPYHTSQHLITPHELDTPEGRAYIRKVRAAIMLNLIPIANENDAVADDEIKFGDNDRLLARIAIGLHRLDYWDVVKPVILTDVDGLYTKDPKDPSAELIRTVKDVDEVEQYVIETDTVHNSGGMPTKALAARMLMAEGLGLNLGKGSSADPVGRLIHGGEGTYFAAAA